MGIQLPDGRSDQLYGGAALKASITSVDVAGRRVLVREDFNVPMANGGQITDDTRIRAAIPTLRDLMHRGAFIVVMSHLGRPTGPDPSSSLRPVARELSKHLWGDIPFVPDCVGPTAEAAVGRLQPGKVLLLENVRFHPEEEKNDPEFARQLAALGEIYVNDAFAASHRAHASVVGVANYLPAYAGLLMLTELNALHQAVDNPQRPFVAVIGGAKVSTKIGLFNHLVTKVDSLLIGGAMANTFLRAQGFQTGRSLVEESSLEAANEVWKIFGSRLGLPVDLVCAQQVQPGQQLQTFPANAVDPGWIALDIGPQTVADFGERLRGTGTIVWNGPMGVFEIPDFRNGTKGVGEAIATSGAYTLVGGGDTAAAIDAVGLAGRFSHVSTGGGATLEYLEGRELPGVAVLKEA